MAGLRKELIMKVYVVLDVEMCRVHSKTTDYKYKNEIIQIGAIMMTEDYELMEKFSAYVRPRYGKIDHFIAKLTGITERTIKDSPDIEEALQKMLQWIGKREAVFYSWSSTDYYQIRNEIREKCRENDCWESLLDPKNWIDYQETLGKRLASGRCLKLSDALEIAEVDVKGHLHNGLDDAYNTARMIAKLETQKDYRTLIERLREKESAKKPLTVSLGSLLQGIVLEPA